MKENIKKITTIGGTIIGTVIAAVIAIIIVTLIFGIIVSIPASIIYLFLFTEDIVLKSYVLSVLIFAIGLLASLKVFHEFTILVRRHNKVDKGTIYLTVLLNSMIMGSVSLAIFLLTY